MYIVVISVIISVLISLALTAVLLRRICEEIHVNFLTVFALIKLLAKEVGINVDGDKNERSK